jgi:cell division septation protein DedD
MTFKDDVRNKTGSFLTKSQEIFEKIFAQATRELRTKRKPKPADQKPSPATPLGTPGLKEVKGNVLKRPEKIVLPSKQPDKVKTSSALRPKTKPRPRAGGGSRVLKASLLAVLLLSIAGFLANYFSIVDFTAIPDLLGLGPKPVVQAPIPRKQPAKPSRKAVVSPTQPQAQGAVSTTSPAPSVQTPQGASREEKLVEIETPTTMAQSKPSNERVGEKAPSAPTPDETKAPVVAAKQESPVPAQTQPSAKPPAPEVVSSPPIPSQYPYSVYLGSFKAPEAVKRALSDYQEKGLSAYWARVDLGDKGVWFRFFAGYFRTKEEAEKYIGDHNIQGATPGITKYANFLGSYGSEKEVEDQKQALVAAGFHPYVIKAPDGKSLVYSGAFDRKEYAEKERSELAAKGIKSELVER